MDINSLVLVNFRGEEKFFDIFNKEVTISSDNTPIEVSANIPVISISPDNLEDALELIEKRWKPGVMVISNDCAMTYGGLKGVRKYRSDAPFGLVVCDQHLDIYSYEYCGEIINKATVIRKSIDDGLIDYVIFVGTRPSEEAAYRATTQLLSPHDKKYAQYLRDNKVLGGLESKIMIIPSYEFDTFSEGTIRAFAALKDRGINQAGLMIDLDCFDSTVIRGVTYNTAYFQRIKDFIARRISEKGKLPEPKEFKRVNDYLLFMKSEIAQKGIPPINIVSEIEKLLQFLNNSKFDLIYAGITEYEPSHGDVNTKELLERIIQSFS